MKLRRAATKMFGITKTRVDGNDKMVLEKRQASFNCFTLLDLSKGMLEPPEKFIYSGRTHPLAKIAAIQLQSYLHSQTDWEHNFGLAPQQNGKIIGKMFGVLVVRNLSGELGYLSAFSGKLANSNNHSKFVPPVYDSLESNGFVTEGMLGLKRINEQILKLSEDTSGASLQDIELLKINRSTHSKNLQKKIFEHYNFLNQAGEYKSLLELFKKENLKNPPSGAGECAGPKLLQFAFNHGMQPLSLAEFWWGLSPKSENWEHGKFYPSCKEKCEPIFRHMLKGLI